MDARVERLTEALTLAVADACREPVTLAFSGGIDSALLALLAARHSPVELVAVGTPGCHDLGAAESAAARLSLNIRLRETEPRAMATAGRELAAAIPLSPPEVEFLLPLWLVARDATHATLLCGQGADELLGGYARYRRDGAEPDLATEGAGLRDRLPAREAALAAHHGRAIACPYLDARVIAAAGAFSVAERTAAPGKGPLRDAAEALGLPPELARRPKKAAQYGSGSQKALRAVRRQRLTLTLDFASPEVAHAVAAATQPDNAGWVTVRVEGATLHAEVAAATVGSLREATDDFLACAALAADVVE